MDGGLLFKRLSTEQRTTLMQQLELFVEMSELEQRVQLIGHLPTVESYQRRRMCTSAVGVCLAIHDYVSAPTFELRGAFILINP